MLEPGRTSRPLNLAWKLFLRVVDPETSRVRAECRGCGRNLVAQVRRMNAHIDWCTKLAGTALMEDFQSNEAQLDAAVDAIDLANPSSPTSSCSRAESVLSVRSMASLETTPAKKSKQARCQAPLSQNPVWNSAGQLVQRRVGEDGEVGQRQGGQPEY